jgi:7,8-dihydropterin-6-yl-methyl-4-(beta-D-ribofuranosyl)aminobenzene 5'-phosphate synthase
MSLRISPWWWPILAIGSPAIAPWLLVRNRRFKEDKARATQLNQDRIQKAGPVDLPELEYLKLTVLVEWRARDGFAGDAGVSYLFESNLGTLLYDVGFGPARPALAYNAAKCGLDLDRVDALAISHLHMDHMGGLPAQRENQVTMPVELLPRDSKHCFLPDKAGALGFEAEQLTGPRLLTAGIASTGPLARSLFVLGFTEEQALLARLKDKGLVVFTGCGHPTIQVVLEMVERLCHEPVYAIGGGLHFPVTNGRGNRAGIQLQAVVGTGKPPWQRITDADLSQAIAAINAVKPTSVYLSAHDTCDHALERLGRELDAETEVLEAGATYRL